MKQLPLTQDLVQKIQTHLLKDFIKSILKLWVLLIYKEIKLKYKMLSLLNKIINHKLNK
jgi:hypothetical protein